jgi:hypothetical protein
MGQTNSILSKALAAADIEDLDKIANAFMRRIPILSVG